MDVPFGTGSGRGDKTGVVSELSACRFLAGAESTVLLLILAGLFETSPLGGSGGGGTDGRTGTVAGVIGGDCGAWATSGALDTEDNDDVTRPEDDDESQEAGSEDAEGDSDDSLAGATSSTL